MIVGALGLAVPLVGFWIFALAWSRWRDVCKSEPRERTESPHWHDGPEEFVDYGVAGGGWVPTRWACYDADCSIGRRPVERVRP